MISVKGLLIFTFLLGLVCSAEVANSESGDGDEGDAAGDAKGAPKYPESEEDGKVTGGANNEPVSAEIPDQAASGSIAYAAEGIKTFVDKLHHEGSDLTNPNDHQ
ncbi:uncharacterized protein [Rhodnius prolixus]|uniref:uncharacterized protein n=1 Tax=Rhodnius prolixus TaxID=13249 RepID=UPI003D18C0AB